MMVKDYHEFLMLFQNYTLNRLNHFEFNDGMRCGVYGAGGRFRNSYAFGALGEFCQEGIPRLDVTEGRRILKN